MASLTGNSINTTYEGLVKLVDNAAVTGTLKDVTDGAGNTLPFQISSTEVNFTGTVSGIPQAGLVSGGQPNTAITGTALMSVPPVLPVGSDGSIVLGNNINTSGLGIRNFIAGEQTGPVTGSDAILIGHAGNSQGYGVAIGQTANCGYFGISLGRSRASGGHSFAALYDAYTNNDYGIALGYGAGSTAESIVIGRSANADSDGNIAIGYNARALGGGGFARGNTSIGYNTYTNGEQNVAIGRNTSTGTGSRATGVGIDVLSNGARAVGMGISVVSSGFCSIGIGNYVNSTAEGTIAIGGYSTNATATFAMAFGRNTNATATEAVAIGKDVTASTAYTVTLKRLQMLDYASLDFADDTAAATGGIPLGGIYHTSGALKVRVA